MKTGEEESERRFDCLEVETIGFGGTSDGSIAGHQLSITLQFFSISTVLFKQGLRNKRIFDHFYECLTDLRHRNADVHY